MTDIVIRRIDIRTELAECVRVIRSSFATVAEDFNITEESAPTNPAFVTPAKMSEYAARQVTIFGLFARNWLIGCVAIEKSKDDESTYFIERLAVIPEERHHGYGSDLLTHAIREIAKHGGRTVSIGIINENTVLKKWHIERHGFVETSIKRFSHLSFEVCFMKKELVAQVWPQFFCSWSGGKDSCLALFDTLQKGWIPRVLLTMMREGGEYSRSHGLPSALIRSQAAALNIPAVLCASGRDDYETSYAAVLRSFRTSGIAHGIFGDIDIDDNRKWVERVCEKSGIVPHEPLWKQDRVALLERFIGLGFKAVIVSVEQNVLPDSFLGQELDRDLVLELGNAGVDPSGENGEYHTIVTDGPIFSTPVKFGIKGKVNREGYSFLDTYAIE
jgi:diphthine-ammonia ligase